MHPHLRKINRLKKMKKLTVVFILMFAMGSAFGQKALRTTAFNYHRKGQLDKALQSIEPTISDPTTSSDPKTWFYRGNIYLGIHMSADPNYKGLDKDALNKAFTSYQKMMELDTKKEYMTEALQNLLIISEQLNIEGTNEFLKKEPEKPDYKRALSYFEQAIDVSKTFNSIDTAAYYNASISALYGENYDKAKQYFNQLIEWNYNEPKIFSSLSTVYLATKDTATAMQIMSTGRQKYPADFNMLIAETNMFLSMGQLDKALANLKQAVVQDPQNASIHFNVGVSYDQMGNFDEAKSAYQKAIEIDPTYFDAYYNLGVLHANKAAEIINEANKLAFNDPKYDGMKKQADDFLNQALPFLEKASELQPQDKSTLIALKEVYTRLSMMDKLNQVNAKLQE